MPSIIYLTETEFWQKLASAYPTAHFNYVPSFSSHVMHMCYSFPLRVSDLSPEV